MLHRVRLTLAVAATLAAFAPLSAHATIVGNIEVCYNCSNNFGFGVLDGPIFQINNLTAAAVTGATFTADGDTYNVGTIGANSDVFLIPGISNDGGSHSGFWHVSGSILDTSDFGPNGDSTPFQFDGTWNLLSITSGVFTPGTSTTASNDGTIPVINFLGGGPISDGPCSDCYGPHVVATFGTSVSAVPLPATLPLLSTTIVGLGAFGRWWKRRGGRN
jgi:hypothetical protein